MTSSSSVAAVEILDGISILNLGRDAGAAVPGSPSSICPDAAGRKSQRLRDGLVGMRSFLCSVAAGRDLLGDFLSLSHAGVFFSKVQLLLAVGVMAINGIHPLPAHRMTGLGTEVTAGRQVGFGIGAPASGVALPLASEIPGPGRSSGLPRPAKSRHPNSVIS